MQNVYANFQYFLQHPLLLGFVDTHPHFSQDLTSFTSITS